jgi:dTDP-4-dehydrorhamnose 3,5-epimerase
MIDGVKVKQLKIIPDDRGKLMEMLRCDDAVFDAFGQVYFTTAFPGVIKAWHFHKHQSDNFICVAGRIKLALYDGREGSPTKGEINEFYMSLDEPKLVYIPKMVHHGFKTVSTVESMVINVITKVYDYKNPDELRTDAFDPEIGYDWNKD